jgi:drug/metabolite transporter (DMT)-like permease
MHPKTKALLLLHLIVLIWGFTGIWGKLISLQATPLVWWRTLIALAGIGLFALAQRTRLKLPLKTIAALSANGLVTAAHWICFFAAIKASNASTALALISTTAFFVAIVGPFITKGKFYPHELLLGIVVVAGVFIIFKFESRYTLGILLALAAAFFAAVFSSFNSVFVKNYSPTAIAFYEMLAANIGISLFLVFSGSNLLDMMPKYSMDFIWLLLLGLLATAFAFIIGIQVMRELSPFTCAITINMEPIYTIVFALWIFGEEEMMSPQFYLGALLLIGTLFLDVFLKKRLEKKTGLQH